MDKKVYVFGHKNPDTDSVASAIALAYLKNDNGENAEAYILDEINKESEYVLDYFNVRKPKRLKDVRIQIKDLEYDNITPMHTDGSILDAYEFMNKFKIRTLPIIAKTGELLGVVTMKDIAMSLIQEDQRKMDTSMDNIVKGLEAKGLCGFNQKIFGQVFVTAFHLDTIEEMALFQRDSIVIVGDRYEIIKFAIQKNVLLIIVTGNCVLPHDLIQMANEKKVNIIQTHHDTYQTSKTIFLTNYVENIMVKEKMLLFNDEEYLDECKEVIQESQHSKFPIVDKKLQYLGILSRGHIINPARKKIILVDHNEYAQSVEGIKQGEILEVIDHHKIGDISTSMPIHFRNSPVGSTNTIVYQLFQENQVDIPYEMAGLMLSGIISDTLLLKSPTTTSQDVATVETLIRVLGIDLYEYAMEMFKNGTDISGKTAYEVLNTDYKEFSLEGVKVGISQVFTLNFEVIKGNKMEYLKIIEEMNINKGHFITMLLVTDIINQGSYLLYNENKRKVVENAFGLKVHQGIFIPECVSRKKQVIPKLIEGIQKTQ
ncbi:MAG: putative manganese-dependent inorganic diphosphatase [Eubacteriaceae bacterium]